MKTFQTIVGGGNIQIIITRKSTSHLLILLQNVTNAHNFVDGGTAWSKNLNS